MHVHTAVHLITTRMDNLDDSLRQSPLAWYFRRCMDHLKSLRRCTILRSGLQKSHSTSGHTVAKWRAMMTLLVRMTSCKPGVLVNSLKTTSHYRFLSMVHSYIVTKRQTAGCSYGSFIIFALDCATQRLLLSQAALFPVPINREKLTLIYFHRSTISLLYNMKASKYLMRLRLWRYSNPFPSSWLHQPIALVLLPCLALLGTVANKGAESTA